LLSRKRDRRKRETCQIARNHSGKRLASGSFGKLCFFRTAEDNQARAAKSREKNSSIIGSSSTTRSQSYQTLAENQAFRSDEIQQKCSTCQPSAVSNHALSFL
jgi:hypothetical protein